LIRVGYDTLGLMTFLTTGEDETRLDGQERRQSAGSRRVIHTDFEKAFIRAEVINWKIFFIRRSRLPRQACCAPKARIL